MGNLLKNRFNISIIDSKYVDKQNLLDNILLLKEIVLNPYVDENGFNKDILYLAKQQVTIDFDLIEESPRTYANYKALELLGDDTNYNLTNYIDKDILKEINTANLYESYKEMIQHSKIDIMISGNIRNEEEIIQFIKDNFNFYNHAVKLNNPYSYHKMLHNLPVKAHEKKMLTQSKLSLVYKLYDASVYENKYVLSIFNSIFGGNGNSLLIKSMREEHSICYYANSYHNKLDNLLVINSGIAKENYDKVIELIEKSFIKMQNGEFTANDIKTAKLAIIDDLNGVISNNSGLVEYQYGREIFQSDDIKTKKEKIRHVSKKEIMQIAKKFELVSIFFLEGDL
jgi:predicted Zn-dependent peptidase